MEKYKCNNIVFSSSASVYKPLSRKFLNENDICEPLNPYGNTKLTVEKILNDIYIRHPSKWRIACLRYFNPIGAHEIGFIGEDPLVNTNNIYPKLAKVALGKLEKIEIFGFDWPTKDGTCIRDYIHVMDVAEDIIGFGLSHRKKTTDLTLNLGTGIGTSVLELIRIFENVNKVSLPYSFVDKRPGDVAFLVANNDMAKNILNWVPKRNTYDMCRDGWNWQLKNLNCF